MDHLKSFLKRGETFCLRFTWVGDLIKYKAPNLVGSWIKDLLCSILQNINELKLLHQLILKPLMAGSTLEVRSAAGMKPLPAACGEAGNPKNILLAGIL
ncbi:hypothetical protein CR513_25817, partial [Mucuna pruriens]